MFVANSLARVSSSPYSWKLKAETLLKYIKGYSYNIPIINSSFRENWTKENESKLQWVQLKVLWLKGWLDTGQVTKSSLNISGYLKNTKQNKTVCAVIYLVWWSVPLPEAGGWKRWPLNALELCHFIIFVKNRARLSEEFFTVSLWSDIMKLV